jgi:hypothetical protein
MLPEIGAASNRSAAQKEKEKICIAIISPNEMPCAFRMHRSIARVLIVGLAT